MNLQTATVEQVEAFQQNHLIFSNDLFGKLPLSLLEKSYTVRFVGVGGPSAAHALSLCLERYNVSDVTLIDFNRKTLDFTTRLIRTAAKNRDPWKTIYDMYGLALIGEPYNWEGLDLSRFTTVTGIKHYELSPDNYQLTIDSPRYDEQTAVARTPVHIVTGGRVPLDSLQLHQGCLRAFAAQLPDDRPIVSLHWRFSDALRAMDWDQGTPTIVWLSNMCNFGVPNSLDAGLYDVLQKLDRLSYVRFWLSDRAWHRAVRDYKLTRVE